MSFRIDLGQLEALSGALERFGAELHGEVAMSGVAAMARVMYGEVRYNVPVSDAGHWFHGRDFRRTGRKYHFEPGTLKAAIYRAFSPEKSSATVKTYRISWNHRKAPYGFMVEFGTPNAAPVQFMRRSLVRVNDSIAAGKARIAEKLQEVEGAR